MRVPLLSFRTLRDIEARRTDRELGQNQADSLFGPYPGTDESIPDRTSLSTSSRDDAAEMLNPFLLRPHGPSGGDPKTCPVSTRAAASGRTDTERPPSAGMSQPSV